LSVTPLVGGSHKRARVLAAACELIAAGAIVPLLPPSAKPGVRRRPLPLAQPDCGCLCWRVRCPLDWFAAAGYQGAASYELLSCPAPAKQETGPISGLLDIFMNTIIGSPHPRRIEW
jgi:hypothetical protein